MKKHNTPQTEGELARILDELFFEFLLETPDEVDIILREAGYDPDQVVAEMQALAERAWDHSSLNWRNRAKQEMEQQRAQLDEHTSSPRRSRAEMIEAIQRLFNQIGGGQLKPAGVHFRNLNQASDDDLASMLAELEYLTNQDREE